MCEHENRFGLVASRRKSWKITVIKAFATTQIIYIHLSFALRAVQKHIMHRAHVAVERLQYECGQQQIRISGTVVCNWVGTG